MKQKAHAKKIKSSNLIQQNRQFDKDEGEDGTDQGLEPDVETVTVPVTQPLW